jgi:hypothetical protein
MALTDQVTGKLFRRRYRRAGLAFLREKAAVLSEGELGGEEESESDYFFHVDLFRSYRKPGFGET